MLKADVQRIEYIDTLRGLCIILIVWYHTDHPNLLNYIFYNPTLFFVSGMLFKPMKWDKFIHKKIFTLFVPFLFFYLLYYVFLLALNFAKYHSISHTIVSSVSDVFRCYTEMNGYTCNYPLWFIWALFWVQWLTNIGTKFIKNYKILFCLSFLLTIIGRLFIQHVPTPFFIGRSFTFIGYYVLGFVFYKKILSIKNETTIIIASSLAVVLFHFLQDYCSLTLQVCFNVGEFMAFAMALLIVCKVIAQLPWTKGITYFGVHSLIVFGIHDMYLTIARISSINIFGGMNNWLGLINVVLTLILMVPTIIILNKFFPFFIGKKTYVRKVS